MLYSCVRKFDVTDTAQTFLELNTALVLFQYRQVAALFCLTLLIFETIVSFKIFYCGQKIVRWDTNAGIFGMHLHSLHVYVCALFILFDRALDDYYRKLLVYLFLSKCYMQICLLRNISLQHASLSNLCLLSMGICCYHII